MRKVLTFCLLGFFSLLFSQRILDRYPDYQVPYIGGYAQFYKDFHNVLVEENLQPCANKNEIYQFSVLITPDSSIRFIKDLNEKVVAENKCTHDLAREVAKYLTGWNPANVNGEKVNAVASFIIYPHDLFAENKTDYAPNFTYPVYNFYEKDHMKHFNKELKNKFIMKRFDWNDQFTMEVEFVVGADGKMKDILLTKKTGLEEFDRMVFYTFKEMKKKWKPATINGQPVDFRYKYTLSALTDVEY